MEKYKASFDHFVNLVEIPDFDLLITFAIGSRHLIHQDIAEKYQGNKDYYYELFKSSPHYNDKRLASLSVFNYRAIQQFMGIYIDEGSLNKDDFTMKLIKKGYRFVFNFVNNQKNVNLYELRNGFLEYVKRNNFVKTINSAHLFAVALYLCKALKKEILFDEFDVTLIKNSIKQIFTAREFEPEITAETEEFLKQYQSIGLHKRDFQLPLNNLITSLNHVHRRQIATQRNLDLDDDNDQINELNKEHHFYKALSQIGIILQYCNIDPIDLQNVTSINHAKMKEIIALCFESQKLELSESIDGLLATYLVINGLATDYNTTKHHLIITSQEEKHNELLHLKREYESKISLLEKEEENNKANTLRLTEKANQLFETVTQLERQLKKKEMVIQDLHKEILSLQAKQNGHLALNTVPEGPIDLVISEEEMADFINKRKCVVVGGLKSWQDHLKSFLPTCRFISPDDLGMDIDFLINVDLVFFNEAINNHAMYQKVKATLVNTDIPICYTGANTNIKISLKKMYDKLKET